MNREELARLIDDQFSAHVFDYSFTAKPALVDVLWPVLARVWEDGYEAGQNDEGERLSVSVARPTWEKTPNPYSEITQDLSTT